MSYNRKVTTEKWNSGEETARTVYGWWMQIDQCSLTLLNSGVICVSSTFPTFSLILNKNFRRKLKPEQELFLKQDPVLLVRMGTKCRSWIQICCTYFICCLKQSLVKWEASWGQNSRRSNLCNSMDKACHLATGASCSIEVTYRLCPWRCEEIESSWCLIIRASACLECVRATYERAELLSLECQFFSDHEQCNRKKGDAQLISFCLLFKLKKWIGSARQPISDGSPFLSCPPAQ